VRQFVGGPASSPKLAASVRCRARAGISGRGFEPLLRYQERNWRKTIAFTWINSNRFVERVKHAGRVHRCRAGAGVDADADAEGFCNFLPWIAITTACATARD